VKEIRCRTGVLAPTITYSGLLPNKEKLRNITDSTRIYHDFCGDISSINPADTCPGGFDHSLLDMYYKMFCAGKSTCVMDLTAYIKQHQPDPTCSDSQALAYMQVKCTVKDSFHKR